MQMNKILTACDIVREYGVRAYNLETQTESEVNLADVAIDGKYLYEGECVLWELTELIDEPFEVVEVDGEKVVKVL